MFCHQRIGFLVKNGEKTEKHPQRELNTGPFGRRALHIPFRQAFNIDTFIPK
jgi:hypothetical protein